MKAVTRADLAFYENGRQWQCSAQFEDLDYFKWELTDSPRYARVYFEFGSGAYVSGRL